MGLMTAHVAVQLVPQISIVPTNLADTAAAVALAREVADVLDVPLHMTWWSLCQVHDDMLALLDSPQGWAALAGYIAGDLGVVPADYAPVVH